MIDIPMPVLLILVIISIIGYIIVKLNENSAETDVEYIADRVCEENNLNTIAKQLQDISYLEIDGSAEELSTLLEDVKVSLINSSNLIAYDTCSWHNKVTTFNNSITYVCPYCGTNYIADSSGFIPNCKNCGATMEKVDEHKI